jgi:hypothetical protein
MPLAKVDPFMDVSQEQSLESGVGLLTSDEATTDATEDNDPTSDLEITQSVTAGSRKSDPGQFQLLQVLGQGSFGKVNLAFHVEMAVGTVSSVT